MPASTTPMMLVHVYSDTPMYGARMRPATSSRMSVQQLATNTTRYADGRDISEPCSLSIMSSLAQGQQVLTPQADGHDTGGDAGRQQQDAYPQRPDRRGAHRRD